MLKRRAIFLDRDGVINENRSDHVKSWAEFVFERYALEALVRMSKLGLPIIVVTNQGAIGRGLTSRTAVDEIHRRLILAVQQAGGRIDHVLYCPHRPDENCDCRKPKPGMLAEAAQRWNIDLANSFLVGDAVSDLQAGWAVGCQVALVRSGRGADQINALQALGCDAGDCVILENILGAAHWITEQLAYERLQKDVLQAVPTLAVAE